MDGNEEFGTAIVGGLDNLLKVCIACHGLVHGGVVDGVPELLQFGDKGLDNGAVNLALTKAFVFGSISRSARCMPRINGYSYGQHLLSGLFSN